MKKPRCSGCGRLVGSRRCAMCGAPIEGRRDRTDKETLAPGLIVLFDSDKEFLNVYLASR